MKRVAFTAAIATVLLGGCNVIVGAGDYSVGGDASTGPSGPDSGDSDALLVDGAGGRDATSIHRGDAGGHLGDPCATNSQCTAGTCDGLSCTQPCNSNAACGMNSQGQPNYCVQNANGEQVCLPGCTVDADCKGYAGASCQPVSGVGESVCQSAASGDAGSSLSVGDPCTTASTSCGPNGDMCNGSWCVATCTSATDSSCGTNSLGALNYCVINDKSVYICFPGCTTNADCTPFAGTTCQAVGGSTSEFICAGTSGDIGDPCSTSSSSSWAACTEGSCDGSWCNTTCASTADTSCGSNTAGVANACVQNTGNAFSCFPGCATQNDCAPYASSYCQKIYGGSGYVCAATGGQVGDPCTTDSDCTTPGATCPAAWCTQSCSSPTDTSCGMNSEGTPNLCVEDGNSDYVCFPGCDTDMDCSPFSGTLCSATGIGSQNVCSF